MFECSVSLMHFFLLSDKRPHNKWSLEEVAEIHKYLGDNLQDHDNAVSTALVEAARAKSKCENGVLHKRSVHLIKKKVGNMKKKTRPMTLILRGSKKNLVE